MDTELVPTVTASLFSPCGSYFIAAAASGDVSVWCLDDIFTASYWSDPTKSDSPGPILTWRAHEDGVRSLAFAGHCLLTGGDCLLKGWNWEAIKGITHTTVPVLEAIFTLPTLTLPSMRNKPSEVNAIAVDPIRSCIFLATGSPDCVCYDLETQRIVSTYSGHTDYLHCVNYSVHHKRLVTGSEDGTARLWDVRNGNIISIYDGTILEASSDAPHATRHSKSTWIGCVATNDNENWIALGAGSGLVSLWFAPMNKVTCALPCAAAPTAIEFYQEEIFSVGKEPGLYKWSMTGERLNKMPTSSHSNFSLAVNKRSRNTGVMMVGGRASKIDVFTPLGHRSFTLSLPAQDA